MNGPATALRRGRTALLAAFAIASAALLAACGPTETADRSASAPADGVTVIRIIAEAGQLNVIGETGRTEMAATGTAYATTVAALDEVQFSVRREGTELVIEALTVDNTALDATIRVPAGVTVEIADSSGDISVRNVAELHIDDASGDIDVRNVGSVQIVDSSGEIGVDGVAGDVRIVDDSSGNIVIRAVTGSITIERDSSGDITISDVDGDVRINDDGSGNIDVRDVGGAFVVLSDSSGTIAHANIRGTVTIP